MELLLLNGSPRRAKSNSRALSHHFIQGYKQAGGKDVKEFYLSEKSKWEECFSLFKDAENVIIIFPLYCDSMPSAVKAFFEQIAATKGLSPKNIAYIVQSGFPESIHSEQLERYLEKFTTRQSFTYLGTVIKGGVEGTQQMPPAFTRKLYRRFFELGYYFALNTELDPLILKALRNPRTLSLRRKLLFRFFIITGLNNMYWNHYLKKNGVYHKRFDKPYTDFC